MGLPDHPDPLERVRLRYCADARRALVVGSKQYPGKEDRRQHYPQAFGVDLAEGDGVDLVHDLEQPLPDVGKFDHVDCCSVLEHVRRPWLMAANIEAVMRPGATILVSVPFVWRVHSYPGDFWRMTPEALEVLFPRIVWDFRKFLVMGRFVKITDAKHAKGKKWLARSEVVACGRLSS